MTKSIVARMAVAEVSDPAMLLICYLLWPKIQMRKRVHLKDRFGYGVDFLHAVAHEGAEHVHLLACWIFLISFLNNIFRKAAKFHGGSVNSTSREPKEKHQPYKSSWSYLILGRRQNHFPDKRNVHKTSYSWNSR